MTEEQYRYLWMCYREEQASGGPARDRLPYTQHFENIRDRFNAQFGTHFGREEVWGALSDLDKNPDRRNRLVCVD